MNELKYSLKNSSILFLLIHYEILEHQIYVMSLQGEKYYDKHIRNLKILLKHIPNHLTLLSCSRFVIYRNDPKLCNH